MQSFTKKRIRGNKWHKLSIDKYEKPGDAGYTGDCATPVYLTVLKKNAIKQYNYLPSN